MSKRSYNNFIINYQPQEPYQWKTLDNLISAERFDSTFECPLNLHLSEVIKLLTLLSMGKYMLLSFFIFLK